MNGIETSKNRSGGEALPGVLPTPATQCRSSSSRFGGTPMNLDACDSSCTVKATVEFKNQLVISKSCIQILDDGVIASLTG